MAAQTGRNQHGDLSTEVDQILSSLKAIGYPGSVSDADERKAGLLVEVFSFIIGRDPTDTEVSNAS